MKPHRRAELLRKVAHFGTPQKHVERTSGAAALSTNEMFHHGLLSRRHFIPLQRFGPIDDQLYVLRFRGGSLSHEGCDETASDETNGNGKTVWHTDLRADARVGLMPTRA